MLSWILQRDQYLFELLCMEGLPDEGKCGSCGTRVEHAFRCRDCFCRKVLCQSCCLEDHRRHPFHSIEEWNGVSFTQTTLFDQGFIFHVGHGGDCCTTTGEDDAEGTNMVIVDRGGVHKHRVQWCTCQNSPEKHIMLLQMGLYPATITNPQTAFTFQALDYFHIDSMECRTSASNFYSKLRRLTNYTFPQKVPVSLYFLYSDKLM
jgi:hypothetical protein